MAVTPLPKDLSTGAAPDHIDVLQPEGWLRPKGYSNGMAAHGKLVFVSGQIGWNAACRFETDDFVGQLRQVLINTLAVLREAGAGPEHVVRMAWFVTDIEAYRSSLRDVGLVYREIMGRNFPTMAVVAVSALVEREAKIEIETFAVIPD